LDANHSVNPLAEYDARNPRRSEPSNRNAQASRAGGDPSMVAPARRDPGTIRDIGTLPPPRYANIRDHNRMVTTTPRNTMVPARPVSSSQGILLSDPEASAIPTLGGTSLGTVVDPGTSSRVLSTVPLGTPIISNYQGTYQAPLSTAPLSGSVLPGTITNQQVVPNTVIETPTYPRSPAVVNSAPFVSGPPCQFDARYMVSPRVYRQSVDCQSPAVPSTYAPTYVAPLTYAPAAYMPVGRPMYGPLIGFGQSLTNVTVGRGVFGQPTAYVQGQPIRNFIRYFSP